MHQNLTTDEKPAVRTPSVARLARQFGAKVICSRKMNLCSTVVGHVWRRVTKIIFPNKKAISAWYQNTIGKY